MARITAQDVLAQFTAAQASNQAQFEAITGALTALTGVVSRLAEGQHATPAPVADLTVERKARKGKTTGARPLAGAALAKHEAKVARDAGLTPAQIAKRDQDKAAAREAATQAYKARKDALGPLNKAFHALIVGAGVKSGSDAYKAAWAGRLADKALLKAALATLTPAERKAATDALSSK